MTLLNVNTADAARADIVEVVRHLFPGSDPLAILSPDFKNLVGDLEIRPQQALNGIRPLRSVNGRVFVGGAGVVLECVDNQIPSRRYALKIVRPSLLRGEIDQAAAARQLAMTEVLRTAQLSHPNVAYLVGMSLLPLRYAPENEGFYCDTPVALLEWVEGSDRSGPQAFCDYLYDKCRTVSDLIRLLRELFSGIGHLHSRGLVHWDIKSANCLVGSSATVKVMDIGNAAEVVQPGMLITGKYQRFTSRENCPPVFLAGQNALGDPSNRVQVTLAPGSLSCDRYWLDLYMAGRMLARALGPESESTTARQAKKANFLAHLFSEGDEQARQCHRLLLAILCRLTKALPTALTSDPETTRYYLRAEQVDHDLRKLLPEFGAAHAIQELFTQPRHVVRIPASRNTAYSQRVRALINCYPVKRLTKHLQLGLTCHVYPGARHVRHEHVIGVLAACLEYVRSLYADTSGGTLRLFADARHIRALLFAAVVHDIGHGAFSHYLEEWPPLFRDCGHEDYAQAALRASGAEHGAQSPESLAQDRKALLDAASRGWLADGEDPDAFLSLVADLLRPRVKEFGQNEQFDSPVAVEAATIALLHSVIDGVIDADKFDYLRRDAHHAGIDYVLGADGDRFFQSLTAVLAPTKRERDREPETVIVPTIAVTDKGILTVESLLLARYQMFNAVYWNKTARAGTAVLQYLVWRYLIPHGRTFLQQEFDQRRSRLLDWFREHTDGQCVEWLSTELRAIYGKDAVWGDYVSLIEAIREREGLPALLCELRSVKYQQRGPGLLTEFRDVLHCHAHLMTLSPSEFSARRAALIVDFVGHLIGFLPQASRDRIAVVLSETSVFIDVPLEGKDQISNLFVLMPSDDGSVIEPFAAHSPMGDAISSAFAVFGRRIRVFVRRPYCEALRGALHSVSSDGSMSLEDCVFDALRRAYRKNAAPPRTPYAPLLPFHTKPSTQSDANAPE